MSKCAKRNIEKSWKKVLTNQNSSGKILLVAAETETTTQRIKTTEKTFSKKVKKVVDKHWKMWYPIKVAAETEKQQNNWTLITKQYIPTPKILTWIFGTKPKQKVNNGRISQDVYSTGSKEEMNLLENKFSRSIDFSSKNLNSRVWSWLRMNAGGVLNTCKSNEVEIFGSKLSGGRVSNAWVTCLVQGDNS